MSAKAAVADAAPEAEGGGGANKKKLIVLIAIVLVVVLAAGGGAAFFLLGGKKKAKGHKGKGDEAHGEQAQEDEGADHEDDGADEDDGHKAKPPVFVSLEPFTVNLSAESADRYLQVGIDVKVASPEIADRIKQHLPEIRNGILMILTGKKVEELASPDGKNRLRVEIRDAINRPLGTYREPPEGANPLKWKPRKGAVDVLLTSFVIQ